jgi:hypothetical protein
MKKSKNLLVFLIVVISIIIITVVSYIVFDNRGKINQGNFRVSDAVLKSEVEVTENKTSGTADSISSILFNLSQKNTLSLLIANQSKASKIYLDNIYLKAPIKKGSMYIYQTGTDIEDITSQDKIDMYPVEKDGQYLIEISMDNIDFFKDASLPQDTKSATFDGTILNLLGIRISDIKFEVSFNLNILDENSKLSTCKIKLKLPENELLINGISINRKDAGDYSFSVK